MSQILLVLLILSQISFSDGCISTHGLAEIVSISRTHQTDLFLDNTEPVGFDRPDEAVLDDILSGSDSWDESGRRQSDEDATSTTAETISANTESPDIGTTTPTVPSSTYKFDNP